MYLDTTTHNNVNIKDNNELPYAFSINSEVYHYSILQVCAILQYWSMWLTLSMCVSALKLDPIKCSSVWPQSKRIPSIFNFKHVDSSLKLFWLFIYLSALLATRNMYKHKHVLLNWGLKPEGMIVPTAKLNWPTLPRNSCDFCKHSS